MSLNAYQNASKSIETPQQTEYRLFVEVTRALIEAEGLAKTDVKLHDALHWNRRMWSTFATDCAIEGNNLPKMLRAQIISLSIWVGKHSSKVIHEGEDIQALIDINKSVMEGLALQERNAVQQKTDSNGQNQSNMAPSHNNKTGASFKV